MKAQVQKSPIKPIQPLPKRAKKAQEAENFVTTHWLKANLDKHSNVKITFSKKPISPEEFNCILMGVVEPYAELLLQNNSRQKVYDNFNNVFGVFLNKLLGEDKIYQTSPKHKKLKEHIDATLSQPEDPYANDTNRLAAYVLCRDVLVNEVGLTEESADLILNKRLDLLRDSTGSTNYVK